MNIGLHISDLKDNMKEMSHNRERNHHEMEVIKER